MTLASVQGDGLRSFPDRAAVDQEPRIGPGLDGLAVVAAVLGDQCAEGIPAALQRAGATVTVMSTLAGARRACALLGSCAVVVVDPSARDVALLLRVALHALSRHGAVVVNADAPTTQRTNLLISGADSVLASSDPDELVAALAAVLRRSAVPAASRGTAIATAGGISVHLWRRTATISGRPLSLSPLEFDLLGYFVAHAGEVLSRDQLLLDVWGYDIGGRDTVTVYVRRLRRKIEVDPSQPMLLQTVWGIGYRLSSNPVTEVASVVSTGPSPHTLAAEEGDEGL